MLLVIDVGNTNITLGVFRGKELASYISDDDETSENL